MFVTPPPSLKKYVSLFEFLQKPAGEKLGMEVSIFARNIGVPIKHRDITNPKFSGKVILYPYGFLMLYFNWRDRQSIDASPKLNESTVFRVEDLSRNIPF